MFDLEELRRAEYCRGVWIQCEYEKRAKKTPILEQLAQRNRKEDRRPQDPDTGGHALNKLLEELNNGVRRL